MSQIYFTVAIFLLVTFFGGVLRILRGPTTADRLIAAQLFATTGVAILLLIAQATGLQGVRDVALVAALLAVVSVVAFVHMSWSKGADE